jgi:hypothetical protein
MIKVVVYLKFVSVYGGYCEIIYEFIVERDIKLSEQTTGLEILGQTPKILYKIMGDVGSSLW